MGRLDKEVISEGVRCGIVRCRAVFLFSLFLRRDTKLLRIALDLFRHSKDFFFSGDIDQPDRREIDIYLNVTVPVVLIVVVDLDSLDQGIDDCRSQFLLIGHFTERFDKPPKVNCTM